MPANYSDFLQTPVALSVSPVTVSGEFNVLDYGADLTGNTDSTTAIQTAITAAATSGGTVFCPPGTYAVSSHLVLRPNVTMLCYGVTFRWTGGPNGIVVD